MTLATDAHTNYILRGWNFIKNSHYLRDKSHCFRSHQRYFGKRAVWAIARISLKTRLFRNNIWGVPQLNLHRLLQKSYMPMQSNTQMKMWNWQTWRKAAVQVKNILGWFPFSSPPYLFSDTFMACLHLSSHSRTADTSYLGKNRHPTTLPLMQFPKWASPVSPSTARQKSTAFSSSSKPNTVAWRDKEQQPALATLQCRSWKAARSRPGKRFHLKGSARAAGQWPRKGAGAGASNFLLLKGEKYTNRCCASIWKFLQ